MEPPLKKHRPLNITTASLRRRPVRFLEIDLFPVDMQREIFFWVDFFVFFGITCADKKRHALCEDIKERFCERWVRNGHLPNGRAHGIAVTVHWPEYNKVWYNFGTDFRPNLPEENYYVVQPSVRGERHGVAQEYTDGRLIKEATWVKNKRHGPARLWDNHGQIVRSEIYRNGALHGEQRMKMQCTCHAGAWQFLTYNDGVLTHNVVVDQDGRRLRSVSRRSPRSKRLV